MKVAVAQGFILLVMSVTGVNGQAGRPDEKQIVSRIISQILAGKKPDDVLVRPYLKATTARLDVAMNNIIIKLDHYGDRLRGKWSKAGLCGEVSFFFDMKDGVMTFQASQDAEPSKIDAVAAMRLKFGSGRELFGLHFGGDDIPEVQGPLYVDKNMAVTAENGVIGYFGTYGYYGGGNSSLVGPDGKLYLTDPTKTRVLVRCKGP